MATISITTDKTPDPAVDRQIQDNWFNGLTLAAQGKIQGNWNKIVGSNALWEANVATVSHLGYQSFPSPTFVSKKGRKKKQIVNRQLRKLTNVAASAKTAFDLAMTNNGADYIVKVNNKALKYSTHMPATLASVGSRISGVRGPATVHVRAICGSFTYKRDEVGGTVVAGDRDPSILDPPELAYIKAGQEGAFRTALIGMMTANIVALLNNDFDAEDLDNANTTMTDVLRSFLTEARKPLSSVTLSGGTGGYHLVTVVNGVEPVP
jgi:hypothetical protein